MRRASTMPRRAPRRRSRYARRVNAAATLNGDLLLGHVFAAHVVSELDLGRVEFYDAEHRLGFAATCNPTPAKPEVVLAAIEACAEDLDEDVQMAIATEATRALELHRSVFASGASWRDAAAAGAKLAISRATDALRPADAAPEAETRKL